MKHHNFPPELKTKMRQYFKKLFEVRSALDEQAILNDLDPTLQQEARHKQLRRRAATTARKSARESSSSVVASFHSVGVLQQEGGPFRRVHNSGHRRTTPPWCSSPGSGLRHAPLRSSLSWGSRWPPSASPARHDEVDLTCATDRPRRGWAAGRARAGGGGGGHLQVGLFLLSDVVRSNPLFKALPQTMLPRLVLVLRPIVAPAGQWTPASFFVFKHARSAGGGVIFTEGKAGENEDGAI